MLPYQFSKFFVKLLAVALTLTGCIYGKKQFNIKPTYNNQNVNAIKLDGLYVGKQKIDTHQVVVAFVFYNNGVVKFYNPIFNLRNIKNKDSVREQVLWTIERKGNRAIKEGGGFYIKDKMIHIQVFRTDASIGTPSFCEYQGRVLNDTTIHIDKCNYPAYPNWCRQDFDLHFLRMDKPDSTNKFMKSKWFWANGTSKETQKAANNSSYE